MTNTEKATDAAAPIEPPTHPDTPQNASTEDKGKGKIVKPSDTMDEDDDEDDEDDDEEGDDEDAVEDEEMDDEDEEQEIDAGAILPQGRRTRGVKVDYTSPEALKKAGLDTAEPAEEDEEDE